MRGIDFVETRHTLGGRGVTVLLTSGRFSAIGLRCNQSHNRYMDKGLNSKGTKGQQDRCYSSNDCKRSQALASMSKVAALQVGSCGCLSHGTSNLPGGIVSGRDPSYSVSQCSVKPCQALSSSVKFRPLRVVTVQTLAPAIDRSSRGSGPRTTRDVFPTLYGSKRHARECR